MKCTFCGAEVSGNAKFCTSCGKEIIRVNQLATGHEQIMQMLSQHFQEMDAKNAQLETANQGLKDELLEVGQEKQVMLQESQSMQVEMTRLREQLNQVNGELNQVNGRLEVAESKNRELQEKLEANKREEEVIPGAQVALGISPEEDSVFDGIEQGEEKVDMEKTEEEDDDRTVLLPGNKGPTPPPFEATQAETPLVESSTEEMPVTEITCPKCGAKLKSDVLFCIYCGTKVQ